MSKLVLDVLKKGREIISSPDKWCREHYAVDAEGRDTPFQFDEACKFCILGSLYRAYKEMNNHIGYHPVLAARMEMERRMRKFGLEYTNDDVSHFNDDPRTDHAQMLRFFDSVIYEVEKENGNVQTTPTDGGESSEAGEETPLG